MEKEMEENNMEKKSKKKVDGKEVMRLKEDIRRLKDNIIEVGYDKKMKIEEKELEVGKLSGDMVKMENKIKEEKEVKKCSYELCN
jgi:hypothetical protein